MYMPLIVDSHQDLAWNILSFGRDYLRSKVDVDSSPQIAMNYGIRSIPTLLLFKGGKVVGQRVGALSKDKLKGFVDEAL